MDSLSSNATSEEIEDEIIYVEVLISSLDTGADDYTERFTELQEQRHELQERLDALQQRATPNQNQTQRLDHVQGMDGSHDWWQTTMNSQPGDRTGHFSHGQHLSPQFNALKRPVSHSFSLDSPRPSKRATPDPSNAGTPTSSVDLSEGHENSSSSSADSREQKLRRQLAGEAAIRRRREEILADEAAMERKRDQEQKDAELARQLSQELDRPLASSSRRTFQTTLNSNGSFDRPLPTVKQEFDLYQPNFGSASQPYFSPQPEMQSQRPSRPQMQMPYMPRQDHGHPPPYFKSESTMNGIKTEPSPFDQNQQARRSHATQVIDLTEDDDDDVSLIAPEFYTPNNRPQRPAPTASNRNLALHSMSRAQAVRAVPPMQMPSSYPINLSEYQNVYNSMLPGPKAGSQFPGANQYPWMQGSSSNAVSNAVNGIKKVAEGVADSFTELGNLINGYPRTQSRSGYPTPYALDDDDENPYGRNYAEVDPAKTTEEIQALLENIRPDEELRWRVHTPEALTVKLHKYQELGLTWLQECESGSNKGGILADEMGLGKTIQMLALMVTNKSTDPRCKTTLIVAPVALLRQWKQEIEQRLKRGHHSLSVFIHHSTTKKKSFRELQAFDVVLTTYGLLAQEMKKIETFQLRKKYDPNARPYPKEQCILLDDDSKWYRVVLDEAQCIKNRRTQTSKAACMLRAQYKFCLTGTPMMNGVEEFYSLIKFLNIRPYCQWEKFRLDISQPLKGHHDFQRQRGMRMLQTLCKATMLRRTKKSTFEGQPILVLPERTVEVDNPEFDADEQDVYNALEQKTQLQFSKYFKRGEVGANYSAILVLLLRLRQAACHPHLIKDFGIAGAADISEEDVLKYAQNLSEDVVNRIKETKGVFECPVCYDAVEDPAIYFPCGHDSCKECFLKLTDPANAIRDGNENGTGAKCPKCRSPIDTKKVTDFKTFKKVHMPELLTAEERAEMEAEQEDEDESDDDDENDGPSDSDDSEIDDEDDVDENGNLKGFIKDEDDESDDSATASETEDEVKVDVKAERSLSNKPLTKKPIGKGKKGKGKAKDKPKKKKQAKDKVTLADLKKASMRNSKARKTYLRRLREDAPDSAKLRKTMDLLREIMDSNDGEKVLIFSQWTSLLDLVEIPIDGAGWEYRRYDGSMNAKERADAVDDFKDNHKNVRIMLVSLKAGNAGLNLNVASQVIILDPFWHPYLEEQAIDRAHRIGQTRNVTVHRLLVKNTVEDRIITLQEKKRELINEALDEQAGQNIARLGVRELAYLFGVTNNLNQPLRYQAAGRR